MKTVLLFVVLAAALQLTASAQPSLQVTRAGQGAVFRWDDDYTTPNFVIEQSPQLGRFANWTRTALEYLSVNGTLHEATISNAPPNMYFRLRRLDGHFELTARTVDLQNVNFPHLAADGTGVQIRTATGRLVQEPNSGAAPTAEQVNFRTGVTYNHIAAQYFVGAYITISTLADGP